MSAELAEAALPQAPEPSVLRRVPLPDTAPPLELVADDGERRPAGTTAQGTLHLVVGEAEVPVTAEQDDDFGPVPTGRADLPDPHTWSRRLVQVLVEVMSGHRPATQLLRWTTPDVYERVRRLTVPPGRPQPRTSTSRPARRRPVVRAVRVCEPADGVAEVGAVVVGTYRAHALAVRLEGRDGRWRATALECG